MITHIQLPDGTWKKLTLKERRQEMKSTMRMTEEDIERYEAIQRGESIDDCIELDENGNRIRREHRPADWLTRDDGSENH